MLQLDATAILDGLNEGVLVNDPHGRVVYVNPALARMLGYAPAEMLGKTIFDFMDDRGREMSRRKLAERAAGASDRFDFRFIRKDGTDLWTLVSARPAIGPDGSHLGSLVAITDISVHKQLERELEVARAELEAKVEQRTLQLEYAVERLEQEVVERRIAEERAVASNVAKTGFLANMSHELRTPLNAVIGYAELIAETPELPVVEVLPELENIRRSGAHLLSLINDVLDLSRIEAGAMRVEPEPFDPRRMFLEILDWVSPDAARLGNTLTVATLDLPESFCGDERRIRQVLINLLSNANKFTPGGEIRLEATGDGTALRFRIADDGPGIAADRHEHIFRPFERGEPGAVKSVAGTGLGLAISRSFARMMRGDITLESAPGTGATFTFTTRSFAPAAPAQESP